MSIDGMLGTGNSTAPPAAGSLAGCYAVIALVALIQLIRIQRRVPEYG